MSDRPPRHAVPRPTPSDPPTRSDPPPPSDSPTRSDPPHRASAARRDRANAPRRAAEDHAAPAGAPAPTAPDRAPAAADPAPTAPDGAPAAGADPGAAGAGAAAHADRPAAAGRTGSHAPAAPRRGRPPTDLAANGPAPAAAAAIYAGDVMHARLKPAHHRFSYRVFSVLLDLDRLDEAARLSPLFSVDRLNVVAVHQKDHGPRDGSPLAPYVRTLAEEACPGLAAGRVLMLTYPRIMGQVFNPLTVYFVYADRAGGADTLAAVVYEVRNTFGGMHSYVLPVAPGELSPAGLRQSQRKDFFVSPFIAMEQTYDFRVLPPGEAVRVRILERDAEGPILSATFAGRREPLDTATLAARLGGGHLLPFKVIAAIHFEAVRLLAKGIKGLPIPKTAKRTTIAVRRAAAHGREATASIDDERIGREPA